LGSNEIKISKDRTIYIVDGSGVLYDPEGLDRAELTRLATARVMGEKFDKTKLSPKGFFVHIDDKDIKLPSGEIVESGMNFRNNFHLNKMGSCELFVPCGGRPEAVNISNVDQLLIDGKPMYKYIVEGANLFFTQDARIKLEQAGAIVFKDASANKGGVTSSSLEVLSALALSSEEYHQHMCVKDGNTPAFYKSYVEDVQTKIEENAAAEFECLWDEAASSGVHKSILTDKLSERINELNYQIRASGLFSNEALRRKVLSEVIPATLLKFLGLETVVKRLPESYIVSILSAHLASRYVYEAGLSPNEFKFYQFMQKYL
jgi:glutamate dehydrogenase